MQPFSYDSPAGPVTIRQAHQGDTDVIVKMIHELAEYERQPEDCHATVDGLHTQLFGERPNAQCYVAEHEGKTVGYAITFQTFSTWECAPGLWIEDIYVRPAYRKLGIGKALFRLCARIARERGCKRLEFSVLDWNKPSLEFYWAHGAKPMSDWTTQRVDGEALARLAE